MRAGNSQESAEMQRRKLTGIGRNVVKKITGREEAGMDEREYYERLAACTSPKSLLAYILYRRRYYHTISTEKCKRQWVIFLRGTQRAPL